MSIKKRYTVILSIVLFIYSAIATSIPLITSLLVDRAIEVSKKNAEIKSVFIIGIILAIVVIVEILLTLLKNYLNNRFYLKLEESLKKKLYSEILIKDIDGLGMYNKAYLEQLFNTDISNVIYKRLDIIPGLIRDISRVLFSAILVLYFDYLFLIGLIVIGIIGLLAAKFYIHFIKPYHKRTLEKEAMLSGFILDSVSNIKIIKAYDAFGNANDYFSSLSSKMIMEKRKRNRINVLASSGLFAFCNLLYVIALCYGGYKVALGALTSGTLMALIQLLSYIETPILEASGVLNALSLCNTSEGRIKECMMLENENNSDVITSFEGISIKNLSFSYDKVVINDLSFDINPGDKVLIKGPSGIGKTTLMMLILGILKPSGGSVITKYNGKEENTSAKSRRLFSYVPQENILFNGTIKENIYILTGVKDDLKIYEALKISNIYDEIMALPKGIDTLLHERGAGLSLGQIQRILIAIAILHDSKVLLLDEFSSALDSNNESIIMNNLSKLDKTIIYITHKDSILEDSKIINFGEINE
ncbi:MAG: ABC transporter ATP-binding protein [Anaeroplasmataceae bacterium]